MPAASPPRKRLKQAPVPEDWLEDLAHLIQALEYNWDLLGREEQNPPDSPDWFFWLFLAGRGTGKTRAGAERLRYWAQHRYGIMHIVGPTAADVRDTMIEGPAGILKVSPPWFRPIYQPSKRLLTWPNGAMALCFSADEPERLRGPQCEAMWLDELCAWRFAQDTWDMAMFGLRLGTDPRCVITSTPKPSKLIKTLVKGELGKTLITRGTTYDNKENLAPSFMQTVIKKYAGTRLGRQEIEGEILEDNPNALWSRDDIDPYRVTSTPELARVVVAIDPAVATVDDGEESDTDDIGIVVAGADYSVDPPHYYVLDDATVPPCRPLTWATAAITCYHKFEGDRVIGEVNNGGALIESTLRAVERDIPYTAVHASRGKRARAEPVSALYEQGRVHHVGTFPMLESEQCEWVPTSKTSPNRVDALVWAITALAEHDDTFNVSRM